MSKELFRKIPKVDELLSLPQLKEAGALLGHGLLADIIRETLDDLRKQLTENPNPDSVEKPAILGDILDRVTALTFRRYRRVVNATGIILNTALGRAAFAASVGDVMDEQLRGYNLLQADPLTGKRSQRDDIIEKLICRIAGAPAAAAMNNNAAATLIALSAVAKGKEVICSAGELIEIGGHFRMPEIMEAAGCRLKIVGCTNRTHLKDYEKAIGPETGALVRVHWSNYKISGFTSHVPLDELVDLGKRYNIPVLDDLGSGSLIDLRPYGLSHMRTVQESWKAGVDLCFFSTDKLIGGPQGGIIIGKKEWIAKINENPLARAFRLDKLALATLEETLRIHLNPERALREIPTLKMLTRNLAETKVDAENLCKELSTIGNLSPKVLLDASYSGGGALPEDAIPSYVVALTSKHLSAQQFADRLRTQELPVIGRIQKDQFILDPRTILPGEEKEVVAGVKILMEGSKA